MDMEIPGKRRCRPVRRWIDNITGYGRTLVEGEGHWGSGEVEKKNRLWRLYLSRKSRKKKIVRIFGISIWVLGILAVSCPVHPSEQY